MKKGTFCEFLRVSVSVKPETGSPGYAVGFTYVELITTQCGTALTQAVPHMWGIYKKSLVPLLPHHILQAVETLLGGVPLIA